MVGLLTRGHEQVIKTCRDVLASAQQAEDESTIALDSDRMRVHEKTAWMLRKNIAVERFRELRCKALPLAEAAGYVTDEDIFRDIS